MSEEATQLGMKVKLIVKPLSEGQMEAYYFV